MEERRKHPRFAEIIEIDYRIISLGEHSGEYEEFRGKCRSCNISEGGLLLIASRPIPVGSIIELSLHIKNKEFPLHFRGDVVRVGQAPEEDAYELGIMFTQYFSKDKELLKQYIDKLSGS